MHDRRIDGKTHVFGNAGALFMSAMTWWDHETDSIWSQPWGRAIKGPLKGVQLNLLPMQLTSWGSWKEEHPETLAMINDVDQLGGRRQGFSPDHVIGLILADEAKAYYFDDAIQAGVINDFLGEVPVVIWANGELFHAYVRSAGGTTLTFMVEGEAMVDAETGSRWDPNRGMAVDGPLKGEILQLVPSLSSFDWAWKDF